MTIKYNNVYVEDVSTVAGPFVNNGPLKDKFDKVYSDFYDGEDTFEKCEIKNLEEVVRILLNKTNKKEKDINVALSADLMNQILYQILFIQNLVFHIWVYIMHVHQYAKKY